MAMSGGSGASMIRSPYASQITPTSQAGGGIQQGAGTGDTQQQQPSQMNPASLCRAGAETVQDIVYHTIELFSQLKMLQLPSGAGKTNQQSMERKKTMQDTLNMIRHLFRKLKIIYDRVNEACGGMDYTPIETLIPYKEDVEGRPELKKTVDTYRHYSEESRELREQLCLRSRYLKEIIIQQRSIIWLINTMLCMRNA